LIFRVFGIISLILSITPCITLSQQEASPSQTVSPVIISFDTKENSTEHFLAVEKETQQLSLFEYNGTVKKVQQFTCSTGKTPGAKTREGDSKTPEGVYFFKTIHEKEKLAPIYGIRAFTTDYPNLPDRIAERTGTAIWLHGTNKVLKPMDSNGCVVLENTDVDKITKYISLNRTPIVITKKFLYEPLAAETRTALSNLISAWNTALQKGTYHEYLAIYDSEYLPDISWWKEWSKIRKHLTEEGETLAVELKRPLIVRYGDTYVIMGEQSIKFSEDDLSVGIKKIFLTNKDNQFRIIGEEYQQTSEKADTPFIVTARSLKRKPAVIVASAQSEAGQTNLQKQESVGSTLRIESTGQESVGSTLRIESTGQESVGSSLRLEPTEKLEPTENDPEITEMIDNWLKAWSSKNIDEYGNYYADDFRSQRMNKKEWLLYKKQLNQKYKYIRVMRSGNPKVIKDGDECNASFIQQYKSDSFDAVATKQLILKRENGKWKIYRETSRRR